MKTKHFDCDCKSAEHTIRFIYNYDEEDEDLNFLTLEVQLNTYRNIFKRIWVAFKYVCGIRGDYGHWDEWILSSDQRKEFVKFLKETIETN